MSETPAPAAGKVEEHASHRKERIGTVVSDKMQKTVVVEVIRLTQHPVYGKTMRNRLRYKAHNELQDVKTGDRVRIVETRPLSKDKHWRVIGKLKS